LIAVRVGPCTVKVTALLVPPTVLTVTFLEPVVAPAVIVNVAVAVVGLVTVTAVEVTPVPEIAAVIPAAKPVPTRFTGTLVPRTPVLGVTDVSVGTTGAVTANVTPVAVPPGVATDTLRAPRAAFEAIAKLAVTVVLFTTVTWVTVNPPPATVTPVAPVRPAPVIVTPKAALPRMPVFGVIDARDGATTLNGRLLVLPYGDCTKRLRVESVAFDAIVSVAVTFVSLTTVKLLTVMPAPVFPVNPIPVAPVRADPATEILTLPLRAPEVGLTAVMVGRTTVNAFVKVAVPPSVTTVTLCVPAGAVRAIASCAVRVVPLATTLLAEIPVPENVIAAGEVRFVPVNVTDTVVPVMPDVGAILVRVGGVPPGSSTAPMSTAASTVIFLGLPKKSVVGAAAH
jgi:hypothetical protein